MIEMVTTRLNDKYELVVPEHRASREEYHKPPYWEAPRLDSMHNHIGGGDVVYYVGAELGEMAGLCAQWGAHVVLFEPNHTAWPIIRAIWEANHLQMPSVYPGFASNVHQPIPKNPDLELKEEIFHGHGWEIQDDGWPLFSRGDIVEGHGFSELHNEADGLPQYRIDDVVKEDELPAPTALIIDVEGSEFEVLKGAEEVLTKYRPKIWLSLHPEMMFGNWQQYSRHLRDWLIGKGYNEQFLDWEHEAHFYYSSK